MSAADWADPPFQGPAGLAPRGLRVELCYPPGPGALMSQMNEPWAPHLHHGTMLCPQGRAPCTCQGSSEQLGWESCGWDQELRARPPRTQGPTGARCSAWRPTPGGAAPLSPQAQDSLLTLGGATGHPSTGWCRALGVWGQLCHMERLMTGGQIRVTVESKIEGSVPPSYAHPTAACMPTSGVRRGHCAHPRCVLLLRTHSLFLHELLGAPAVPGQGPLPCMSAQWAAGEARPKLVLSRGG